ncbi:prepilin-type N-terminal cleavage/methylation domain-containing protein [Thiomicrospira microaerophila]|uniref:prepilin-type N-terminal cleavage/methylation domain-containing protein n=1 Tax=Thiomicrospira microaerophila TaxID=406020 RepID=UPI00200C6BC6|nr:prepilin-type N-terminal cleavage/methylation domain-containing protein [Thiomicrospira microaerophila]UQB43183.1 prepilin-type N-terminal cleavage/methylation domain-containing protein [Thiomicrospira microaerophila]
MTHSNQKGFTLVEIAIVLVIIGLLLGGVLQGQTLIKNAKIKSAAGDVNGYQVALYGYQDRFGDLFNRRNHVDQPAGTDDFVAVTDGKTMVDELIARDLVGSRGVNATIQQHALGGNIVLHKNGDPTATPAAGTINGLATQTGANPIRFNWAVCYQGIDIEEDARALIRAIDGSDTVFTGTLNGFNNGRARLVNNSNFAAADAFATDGTTTTVCFSLQ